MRDQVDTWLAARWPTVVAREATYFANHGRYWQGLRTCSVDPAYTVTVDGSLLGDQLNVTPSDQPGATWLDVLPEWATEFLPAAIRIEAYDGPSGKGFLASVFATYNGTLYTRSQNSGPETWRTVAWHAVTPPLL